MPKVIHLEAMRRHFDRDLDVMEALVTAYLEHEAQLRSNIETALSRRDLKAAVVAVHSLKGTVAGFFANRVTSDLEALEADILSGHLEGLELKFARTTELLLTLNQDLLELKPTIASMKRAQ